MQSLLTNVYLHVLMQINHPILNEQWLQNIIANDPEILGLGDLVDSSEH